MATPSGRPTFFIKYIFIDPNFEYKRPIKILNINCPIKINFETQRRVFVERSPPRRHRLYEFWYLWILYKFFYVMLSENRSVKYMLVVKNWLLSGCYGMDTHFICGRTHTYVNV